MLSRSRLLFISALSLSPVCIHTMEEVLQQDALIQIIAHQADVKTRNTMRQVNRQWHAVLLPFWKKNYLPQTFIERLSMPCGFWQDARKPGLHAVWNLVDENTIDLEHLLRCRAFIQQLLDTQKYESPAIWYNPWTWKNAARKKQLIEEGCQLLTEHGSSYLQYGLFVSSQDQYTPSQVHLNGAIAHMYLDAFLCHLPNHPASVSLACIEIAQEIARRKEAIVLRIGE